MNLKGKRGVILVREHDNSMRSEVLMAVSMKMAVFRVVVFCSLVEVY
jgi:hypothetical protein